MLQIRWFHGLWGMSLPSLEANLRRIREGGFDGVGMGVRHRSRPVEGVQFHPESVLTPEGKRLITNWLEGVGL